ncbi:MAG: flagellar basal body rod protein FlgC [Rhodocyclales bacterium]|nr:flagellar basal body rod protein FlgC [Rhodocyclales bacterium]
MDFSYAAAISASGMDVERTRLDVSAINLANVHTSRTAEGGAFKPLRVVAGFGQVAPFSKAVALTGGVPGARVVDIRRADVPPRMAYEPGHPDADAQGFVAYPGVDTTLEMVNVMTAVRAYEANVIAMNAAKAMATKALEIGGGQ